MKTLSPQTLRRAAERVAAKQAARTVKLMTESAHASAVETGAVPPPTPNVDFESSHPVPRRLSDAQLAANRANSRKSTGPSEAGKAKSCMNALRTGLTGRTVLIHGDDIAIYQEHVARHVAKYSPFTADEKDLVQSIADTTWRLLRIVPPDTSVLTIGRENCGPLVANQPDPLTPEPDLHGHIFLIYRKELNNISLQERRLRNQLKSDTADLEALQTQRSAQEKARATSCQLELDRAAQLLEDARKKNIPVNDLREFGFDFSTAEMFAYHRKNAVYYNLTRGRNLNFDQFLASYRAQNSEKEAQAA